MSFFGAIFKIDQQKLHLRQFTLNKQLFFHEVFVKGLYLTVILCASNVDAPAEGLELPTERAAVAKKCCFRI